jgi:hypothetical protein
MPSRRPRPLWTCPKCGHRFVTKNLWHSCGRHTLASHFAGADPVIRRTFNRWRELARSNGPVTVYAQKSRIIFMVRLRFGGATVHKTWLDARLWLKRRPSHPLTHRLYDLGSLGYDFHVKLTSPDQIDQRLETLMSEAYTIGCQKPEPQ